MSEGSNLIGVDIGSSSVKVCQVKETRRGLLLQRVGFAALPRQTIVDGQVRNPGAIIEALKRVFADTKIRQREVALSVSGQTVIIRKISVPLMTSQELAEHISWEAEQHVPFDIKDVQVDYQVLRRRAEDNQMDLLLVAAKKDQIGAYAQLARDAKLKPVVVDVDAFTLQNLFELTLQSDPGETVALINVGADLTSLNIVTNGVSAHTREIANGGNTITEEIARGLGTSFDHAELLKCTGSLDGGPPPPRLESVLTQAVDSIAAEIRRSLDFFVATTGEGEIHRILLTGGTANLPALASSVERHARVKVQTWYPTQSLTLDQRISSELLRQRSTQMAVALGLALRKEREVRE